MILLDTHAWLWLNGSSEKIPARILEILSDTDQDLYLSAASAWEIGIKFARGKLDLPAPPGEYIPSRMAENGIRPLPIRHSHVLRAAALPTHHRDPFDRVLVAQAQLEELKLLSTDPILRSYDVEVLWLPEA